MQTASLRDMTRTHNHQVNATSAVGRLTRAVKGPSGQVWSCNMPLCSPHSYMLSYISLSLARPAWEITGATSVHLESHRVQMALITPRPELPAVSKMNTSERERYFSSVAVCFRLYQRPRHDQRSYTAAACLRAASRNCRRALTKETGVREGWEGREATIRERMRKITSEG